MPDARDGRFQPVRLSPNFFSLDIRKSIFIKELQITLPQYYVEMWGEAVLSSHNEDNYKWDVIVEYYSPKRLGKKRKKFCATLTLGFSKGRSKTSSYRLRWKNDFAIQVAGDYPKSFVRALEYEIGNEYYNQLEFTEFDIGGFKEQLQVKVDWNDGAPKVVIKELFRVRDEQQGFPKVYNELSSYLIADYLLSSEEEILRRIQVTNWKPRSQISKELNENNIYLLLNRESKEIYFGETKQSLSKRYPITRKHHSFDDWDEYSIIQLPPETSEHSRLLIERVLIAVGAKLFANTVYDEPPVLKDLTGMTLKNRKK